MSKAKKLRELFANEKIIRVVGAHNALSAKLVEGAGFDAVWSSGLEISTSFGVPDANILTMTDFLNVSSIMNEAVSIPIVADCDTGFGNSNNVIHMVKKYEAAGIAAVCLEDKYFPKVNSFIPGRQELASISEFVGKILAAKNAQLSKDFMVIARVEALIAGWGMDEALRRAGAYADAGADAILIHSKSKTIDEIAEFAKRWKNMSPLVVVPTTYCDVHIDDLSRINIKMVIYANQGIRASIKSMQEVLGRIHKDGTSRNIENHISTMEEVFCLQGMHKMKEDELVYSSTSDKIVAVIPAAGDHLEEYSMKDISKDIPITMLDINGKSLLQRQADILNRSKIYDIRVIGGYKKEKISVEGVKIIPNLEYETRGMIHSIMCALKDIKDSAFIIYGDTLFDYLLISKILNTRRDITLAVDTSNVIGDAGTGKKPELVLTDGPVKSRRRSLHQDSLHAVKDIGSSVKYAKDNLQFTGIMFLSQKGVEIFKKNYAKYEKEYARSKSPEAGTFCRMNLIDFLKKLHDSGYGIDCLYVNSGWMEIHSLDDYKLACSIFK
ncbi:MAG: phosphoenolpyruvate mutase [Candidatus Omnitrophota bacterium]|nr:phosphoenolpyruvate mutase [Candidatus Omnitrophota bacterium]